MLEELGVTPTNCGMKELERSSVNWKCNKKVNKNKELHNERMSKSCYKVWNRFLTWLRHKKVKVIKYFHDEFQWNWKYDEMQDLLCVKIKENKYEVYKQDQSNMRNKVCFSTGKINVIGMQCYGIIGIFSKVEVRVLEK